MLGVFCFLRQMDCHARYSRWLDGPPKVGQLDYRANATRHTYAATQRHALLIVTAHKQKRFFITMALTTPIAT
ncbi:hypothetical protein [Pseudomonas syringae group genomosp. 3]|uniref:hypothetical protein n=1 Tax=Pseudomonas syringae group genomosp. 3 TaxID=251701 RepID=UPI0016052B36|nr:hypothetical protein [Pseudomonas syringae group genomosp. 3]